MTQTGYSTFEREKLWFVRDPKQLQNGPHSATSTRKMPSFAYFCKYFHQKFQNLVLNFCFWFTLLRFQTHAYTFSTRQQHPHLTAHFLHHPQHRIGLVSVLYSSFFCHLHLHSFIHWNLALPTLLALVQSVA